MNRINSNILSLGVPISYFFEGLDGKAESADTILHTRAGLELVRDYDGYSMEIRRATNQLIESLINEVKVPPRKPR